MTIPSAQAMLEPCPFCGGEPQRNNSNWGHFFLCDCGGHGPYATSPAEAAQKWNARSAAPPAAVREITDAMVEAGARVQASRRGHKDCDASINTTNKGPVPVWKFYTEESSEIIEAALATRMPGPAVSPANPGRAPTSREEIAKIVCCPDGCILADCDGKNQCIALKPEYPNLKTADVILAALPSEAIGRELPRAAINNLTHHQFQCDMDGVMVQVSRQALDEVLTYLAVSRPTRGGPDA